MVHVWDTDCLWFVDDNKGVGFPVFLRYKGQCPGKRKCHTMLYIYIVQLRILAMVPTSIYPILDFSKHLRSPGPSGDVEKLVFDPYIKEKVRIMFE